VGFHYDEAANGILAAEIAHGEKHPLFIPSYTGKEVLFFYWVAVWMRVMGESILALRFASAVAGLCTVAAAAWSAYELFYHWRERAWIALFTATFLATSFWHLILSRYGFRAVTQPLLQALTVGALWRGLRMERREWLALSGLLAGATLYTYLAARAFPLPLGITLMTLILTANGYRRARLGQAALFAASAAFAAAPLAVYFAAHPAAFTTRMAQVAARSWAEAWDGFRACLQMFFFRGDPCIRFNLPYRPLLDPITSTLFLIGISQLMMGRLLDKPTTHSSASPAPHFPRPPLPRPSNYLITPLFLFTLLPTMLLPSALATAGIAPSNLRVVGLLPFLYIPPALPLATLVTRWASAWRKVLLLLFLLAYQTPLTVHLYFHRWAPSHELYEAADGDLADAARYLNEVSLEGIVPYVASIHYRHPTVAFLAEDYPRVKWLTGGETLVFPSQGEGLLILPRSADRSQPWIEEQLGAEAALSTPSGPDGRPAFHAYRIRPVAIPTPTHPLTADFGHAVTLLGYDLLGIPRSGGTVEVVLYWRVDGKARPGDLLTTAALIDPWDEVWGETRPFHYPAEEWTPGEVWLDHLSVPVTAGAPPGKYQLRVGFYAASDGSSLPVLNTAGAFAGIGVNLPLALERATVPPRPADLPIQRRLDLPTDIDVTLLGVNLETKAIRQGEPVRLTLFWQADRVPEARPVIRLRLGEHILYEGMPVHGTYPFDRWAAGEVVADRYALRTDAEILPGAHLLELMLVETDGTLRLGPVTLGEVIVEATERVFTPPPMDHSLGVPLGDAVELLGYDLKPERPSPGERAILTLYWRALRQMEKNYTVFVHLLEPAKGVIAQHDGMPVDGTYPTSLWVPGEVVADPHPLDLPEGLSPGTYTLEVGMYLLETGTRLPVPGSPDDAVCFPLDVATPHARQR